MSCICPKCGQEGVQISQMVDVEQYGGFLNPPAQPSEKIYALIVGLALFSLVLLLVALASWQSEPLLSLNTRLLLSAYPVFLYLIAVWGLEQRRQSLRYKIKWTRAMARWGKAYYCSEDEIFYTPDDIALPVSMLPNYVENGI